MGTLKPQEQRTIIQRCRLSDRSGDRSAGGRRFHVAGPLTAKLRCPVAVQTRGTSRVPVAACISQMLTTCDGSSGYAEVAEIGWSDIINTLPGVSLSSLLTTHLHTHTPTHTHTHTLKTVPAFFVAAGNENLHSPFSQPYTLPS